jgi:hypothetical protein
MRCELKLFLIPKLRTSAIVFALLVSPTVLFAHDPDTELHFSHPLITESPSPDSKVRFDYFYQSFREGIHSDEHTPRVEFEYAFRSWISVEMNVPYTFLRVEGQAQSSHTDNIELAVKIANLSLKEKRILFVYGLSVELPSGTDSEEIGTDHIFEIEPYFGFGVKREKVEVVAFSSVGAPVNRTLVDEDVSRLGYELSFLFKPTDSLQPLIELDGETLLAGAQSGQTVINLSPGIKVRPFHDEHWQIGAGIGFPLIDDREFHRRVVVSAFYHF